MWIQAAVLLLACCLRPNAAQSVWDNPVRFSTKAKDNCVMSVTGHGELTRLRVSCQGVRRSYWCEYVGKPQTCRTYNKNPRHYFVQMMWTLRKLPNACLAPRSIKPHMCRKATDESQMLFSAASFPRPHTDTSARPGGAAATRPQPARPQPGSARPNPARQTPQTKNIRVPSRGRPTQRGGAQPTAPPNESNAKRVARQYCWRSLQGLCSVVIGWFRK